MKSFLFSLLIIIIGIITNLVNYNLFLICLSIVWYIASILIIHLAIKKTIYFKGLQFKIRKLIKGIKINSDGNITPFGSLCISLAAKIGVGSLSGVALAIYFGGVGVMFWLIIISLLIAINTYYECILGIKYRVKIKNNYYGGPSYYIDKSLNNKKLSILYSIILIISYSVLFLGIQANTITSVTNYFRINKNIIVFILLFITLLIIKKGIRLITKINNKLVPVMVLFYLLLGIYVVINNYYMIPNILLNVIKEAFRLKSIIPVFLMGMQRAIFVTESSIGTSAIAASSCDNYGDNQAKLEVLGIYIIIFLVCFTTFIIIVTSNYYLVTFNNINGIEIILYAFNYHFGILGSIFLAVVTIMFAFSTIIASYFLGENNIYNLSSKRNIKILYGMIFLIVIVLSSYVKSFILWNLCDYFLAVMAIINVVSMIKISNIKN